MAGLTEASIRKLKVNELKAELSKRGLVVKGKKDELVNRLLEAIAEEGEDEIMDEMEAGSDQEEGMAEEVPDEDDNSPIETSQEGTKAEDEEVVENEEEEDSNAPDSSHNIEGEAEPATEDYVVVQKPAEEEASEIEKAAEAQDAVIEEQEVTEGTGEEETPMEVAPTAEVTEESVVEATEDASVESSNDASAEAAEAVPAETAEAAPTEAEAVSADAAQASEEVSSSEKPEKSDEPKSSEKEAEKKEETKEETPKEPEIPDVMATVEDEEGEIPEEFEIAEGQVVLDPYLCDLNFVMTNNGTSGHTLTKNGFNYLWAGAKANKGAKGGKVGYELKVIGFTPHGLSDKDAKEEKPVNAVRIGWSSEFSNLMLGESSLSYGFESTGKVCASSSFFEYGADFSEGDVIGTYLDLESEPKTLRYTKNGEDLGVAMSLTVNLEEKPLFPHVYIRNVNVELNFGGREEPWFSVLEGYSFIQDAESDHIADKVGKVPAEIADCEVLMMVGLPSSGKTSWAKKHCDSHPKRHYNVIGLKQVLDRCRLEGKSRKKGESSTEKLNKAAVTVLTKLYQLCPKRKRNYIFDQNNVYKIAQELKMAPFAGFKRKAVLVVPMHDSLRRRTSDAKRRGETLIDIPFGDFCDMKCEFHVPEQGELFDEIIHAEMDEKNTEKTVRDYKSDGSRAKRMGRDEHSASKRKRYDEQRSSYDRSRDNRYSGSGYGGGRQDSWKSSSGGGGYDKGRSSYNQGGYGSQGGYNKGYNRPSNDPYRRNSGGGGGGGGGYRQQSSYGGGSNQGYRSNNNYNNYNQGYNQSQGWGNSYNNQGQNQQQWGQWGGYNNYNNSSSSNNNSNYRGGGGYSY